MSKPDVKNSPVRWRRAAAVASVVLCVGMTAPAAFAAEPISGGAEDPGASSGLPGAGQGGRLVLAQTAPDRIAGANRWDTAGRIAAQFGGARFVIVANGSDAKGGFDALAANYLAGVLGAPILLTATDALPAETSAAVKATFAAAPPGAAALQVLVMGKADSVSDNAVAQINALAQQAAGDKANHVVRVAGASRYETAVAAATLGGDDVAGAAVGEYSIGSGSAIARTAFLASGTSNADALAAGPLSNALRIPVYLTGTGDLSAQVANTLTTQGITNLIVLGGPDRVSDSAVAQAKAAGVRDVIRIAGTNRFDTAARLYDFARGTLAASGGGHYGTPGAQVFLANGLTGFPDALAVGPLAAKLGAALLTTSQDRLEPPAKAFLAGASAGVTALGKDATVSDAVLAAAKAAGS